ncbi:restriction endonuclease subunit S [Bacillus mycoides]|uniref:restriction endonuclease subunit S n=1 Tax=Bacillus mycoides TaxID=1405 RepID=UPI003D652026
MTKQTNLVPKRRFKEFQNTHAWEQHKLGEQLELENGYAFKSKYFQDETTKEIVLTPGNVNIGGGFQDGKGHYYDVSGIFPQKFVMKPGDIFVTMTDLTPSAQALGFPAFIPNDGNVYLHNQRLGKLINYDVNKDFLFHLLCTEQYHKQIVLTASGTTVKHSSPQKILDCLVGIPSIEEQEKIGIFFRDLNNLITLHQRKLEKTKALKSAYLSDMFPAEGEREPKRRFAGFTHAWEQRKLGEVADIIGGGTPSTSNEEYWDGDIDWYAPVEIGEQTYIDSSQKKITELGLQKSSAKVLPIGTVLFTSRAGIGNTAILAKEGATNQGFQSIVPHKDKLDSYFIYSRTHELKRYGETNGAGSTFVEVSGKQMAKMPMLIPTLEEQKKIGGFFERLDHLIALHQRKLEKLQNIKKAYLNDMFV